MQFEVAEHRMNAEFGAPIDLEVLPYTIARQTAAHDVPVLSGQRSVEVLTRSDGALLALFVDQWRLAAIEREYPTLTLRNLIAAQ